MQSQSFHKTFWVALFAAAGNTSTRILPLKPGDKQNF